MASPWRGLAIILALDRALPSREPVRYRYAFIVAALLYFRRSGQAFARQCSLTHLMSDLCEIDQNLFFSVKGDSRIFAKCGILRGTQYW